VPGIAIFKGISRGTTAAEALAADCDGAAISAIKKAVLCVVAPDATDEMNTRNTVAVVAVAAAVATGVKRILYKKDPSVPAVKALNISVPIVPLPSERTLAAPPTATEPILGVRGKMGAVFAAMVVPI
jgi:hypothetical protein